jgi:hypothetical protein
MLQKRKRVTEPRERVSGGGGDDETEGMIVPLIIVEPRTVSLRFALLMRRWFDLAVEGWCLYIWVGACGRGLGRVVCSSLLDLSKTTTIHHNICHHHQIRLSKQIQDESHNHPLRVHRSRRVGPGHCLPSRRQHNGRQRCQ